MAPKLESAAVDVELSGECVNSELELLVEESDHALSGSASASSRRVAGMGLGIMALVACGVLLFSGMQSTNEDDGQMTLRMLLESPEVHHVSAQNIMKVQMRELGQSGPSDGIHKTVADKLKGVSRALKDVDPEFDRKLDEVTISRKHHDAVVHTMRYLSDARVQSVGLDVARAMRSARSNHPDVLEDEIVRKLEARRDELLRLHKEVFPAEVRSLMSRPGEGSADLLQPDRIRALKTLDDSWSTHFNAANAVEEKARRLQLAPYMGPYATTTAAPLATALDVIGIIGAVAQEASVLLRMIKPLTKILPNSNDINVPPQATTAIGLVDALFNTVSCELDAAQDSDNPVEMVTCPLMSGSAAFDGLRIVFTRLGLLGDNNATNGVQGNHAGAANATLAAQAANNPITCVFYGNCGATTTTTTAVLGAR